MEPKQLEDYIRFKSTHGYFNLMPKNDGAFKVVNLRKLTGGVTNSVYSFTLNIDQGPTQQNINLIMKSYTGRNSIWFSNPHIDEEQRPYVREYETLNALTQIGFPVPQAYLCETNSKFFGFPFILISKEEGNNVNIDQIGSFAITLATLHNLTIDQLGLQSLRFPRDSLEFANTKVACLKHFMKTTKHYGFLKRNFSSAINWLDSYSLNVSCPKYCLLHGEYHPRHTLLTNNSELTVIDWENAEIGDPAFDVAYAYNTVKLMYANSAEEPAEIFLAEYIKKFKGEIQQRLEFYKMVSLLGVAIVVSTWISNPIEAYKSFGKQAFLRAMTFPVFHSDVFANRLLGKDFLTSFLDYCQDYIKTTLNI